LFGTLAFGQAQSLSIGNYQVVSEQSITQTQSNVTYRADLMNTGTVPAIVTATVTSLNPYSVRTNPGQDTLRFPPVLANGQVTSTNTFTVLIDHSVPFSFSTLQWSFQTLAGAPVANAGPNQTVPVGSTVTLNGSGSTNPSGLGTLAYSWAFTSRPIGSAAFLERSSSVMPSFVVDVAGSYVITLTVSNGVASSNASVTISTVRTPPVANAGPNQTVAVGSTVVLNGGGSTSVDGRPLTYSWSLTTLPTGSTAALTRANTVAPIFVADMPGTYVAQLIVNDGLASKPSTVTIKTQTISPVANAGPNQVVVVGALVVLNGSGSTDANGHSLTYHWSLISLPAGSAATLSSLAVVDPTFTADRSGTYVAQLIVNDGAFNSAPATVTISTQAPLAPTANAGPNRTVNVGSMVTLNGSGTDPHNLPLDFLWSLINRPAGSAAVLSSTVVANPSFSVDLAGTYVAQLIVSNGLLSSAPSTVTISTGCTQPAAIPGPNQTVAVGATVKLNGNGSGDACLDPLTYAWSFTTRPAGSAAALSGSNTASPTFVADLAGIYVVQLIVNNGFTNSNPATLTITATGGPAIAFVPSTLTLNAGATQTLTLNLSAPAVGGQTVSLNSSNTSVATVPPTVAIAAGTATANVPVTGVAPGYATIGASTANFGSATASLTVSSAASQILLGTNVVVAPGQSEPFQVMLGAVAPPGGVFISLSSTDTSKVTVAPATIYIAQGATLPTRTATVTGINVGLATITALAYGFPLASTQVQVGSGTTMNFSPVSVNIIGTTTQNLTLNLSSVAPPGGLPVSLSSSNSSVATVPSTVVIAAGAATVSVPVTGIAPGSAAVSASAPKFANATASVTVSSSVGATVTWYAACWEQATIFGITGNFQAIDFALSTPVPVLVQGSLFFTTNCDPSQGIDNMNDTGLLTGSGHMIKGFTHDPDVIPSSAIYWIGDRTTDGMCAPGQPCSGCVNYTKTTLSCSLAP